MEPTFAAPEPTAPLSRGLWQAAVLFRPQRRLPLDAPRTLRRVFAAGVAAYVLGGLAAVATSSRGLADPLILWVYLTAAPVLAVSWYLASRVRIMPGFTALAFTLWAGMLGTVDEYSKTSAAVSSVVLCTVLVSWMGTEVAPQYVVATLTGNLVASVITDDPYLIDRMIMLGICVLFLVVVVGRLSDQARTTAADREALLARLAHESRHDPLTGLANRSALLEALTAALHDPAVDTVMLSFADLDGFKRINDVHGHLVGDEVLCTVAERLTTFAGSGIAVRIGGDEFAVLSTDPRESPETEADHLEAWLDVDVPTATGPVAITASVGSALGHGDEAELEDLLRKADLAMYERKRARKASDPAGDPTTRSR